MLAPTPVCLFAGHTLDESVISIAITKGSKHMLTGDSSGIVKSWSLEDLIAFWQANGLRQVPDEDIVTNAGAWRAHEAGVSSIEPVEADESLVLTSSFDCNVALWTTQGAHVGTFGQVCCCDLFM